MTGPIDSKVDSSVLNAMRAWRRQTERRAEEKLALLRRLRRQYETGSLPKYTETQVEQSFNEQIFARVFDYVTLLSHDGRLFHDLHVQQRVASTRRKPDFAIGAFSVAGAEIIAAAELKDPRFPLDQPEGKRGDEKYEGLTPVQQAFRAVHGLRSCQWIIVSNYQELRLYRRIDLPDAHGSPPAPVVKAILPDIRDKNDLARLCAHFDRRALLGAALSTTRQPRSELMAALDRHHPATPIQEQKGHVRAVLLFTPHVEEDFALFRLERRLSDALPKSPHWPALLGGNGMPSATRFELAEGCISAIVKDAHRNYTCKVSLSGLGQLQVSVLRKLDGNNAIDTTWLVEVARFFVSLVDNVYHELSEATRPGRVSPELRDVKDVLLRVDPGHQDAAVPSSGKAETEDVRGVDFAYTPVLDKQALLVADVVSELAIYFRSPDAGVGVDRERFLRELK